MKNNGNEGKMSSLLSQKIWRTMKITTLFIVLGIINVMASDAYSQKAKITLSVTNASLEVVLDQIESQSEFYFLFNQNLIDINRKVQVNAKNQKISKILDRLFEDTGVTYEVFDRQIVLTKADADNTIAEGEPNDALYYKNRANVKGTALSANAAKQIEKTISGKLTDAADGTPLIGANVVEKGTTNGTVTDADGKYKLSVADNATTLIFSYIGYETQEVEIGNQSVIDLAMTPDLTQLEEIVVVGYGSVKKSDLTGSVASVSAEELTAYPAVDALQSLQGRAAGVTITSSNGEPGSAYRIQIRGNTSINASNDPLFVVDGLIGGVMPPPEDIESMEILKDASATAIYGARGANGVVMVTTRRGKKGTPQINFSSSWSSQKEVNRLELLNADQFTSYIQEIDPSYTPELTGAGTDWQDEIYRTGGLQNYQLSVGGATDKVSYYVSGTVFDQKGIVQDSRYKRYSLTSNIDVKASKIFNFGTSVFARRTKQSGVRTQEGGDAAQTGVISGAYKFMPTQGIRDANGRFSVAERGFPIDNPYAMATELENETIQDLFQGNVYAEINIVDGLKFKTTLGSTVNNSRYGQYYPTTLERGDAADGEATLNFRKSTSVLSESYLTYSKSFSDMHDLTVMAGYSYQKNRSERVGVVATGFTSDSFSFWNLGNATDPASVNSNLTTSEFEAFFGRLNYTLNGKYLLTLTGRSESSSVFAKNNKTGFFPSAALGWKVSDESFLSGSNTISLLKLRASWGQVGNQGIGAYQSLASFRETTTTVQDGFVPALFPAKIGNVDLGWETTTQTDIGVDFEVLGGRIALTADYYIMTTDDLLFNVPLPAYTGFSSQLQNIGVVQNKGFELAINGAVLQGDLTWNTGANITFNKNTILELVENETDGNDILYSSSPLPGGGNTQILREGESVGTFWGFVYQGVSQAGDSLLIGSEGIVGGESFKDLNGDGELTEEDRTIIGDPNPDFTWGWNNDFSYKGFSLNIFIQGTKGGDMLNYTLMELGVLNGRNNATVDALNRWTPTNTDTDIPVANAARSFVTSDRWIEDGSYVRVKNVSLSYNLPQSLLDNIGLRTARIYVSGQNLLTFTKYNGLDPEVVYSGSASNLGLDYGSYPNVKSYTVGLNIGF